MSTFYDRLLSEKQELDEKLDRLTTFLETGDLSKLDGQQVTLLNIQSKVMASYSQILLERITLIKKD